MSRWYTAGASKSLTAPDICVTRVLQMSGTGCASISALYVSPYELPLKPTTMRNHILEAFRLFCKTSAISDYELRYICLPACPSVRMERRYSEFS
jgi:hypothetical protein